MSNVSIFEKSWTEIVFEGRNKSYGAYQLRNDNPRTTLTALLLGLLSIVSVAGIVLLVQALNSNQQIADPIFDEPVIVTPYNPMPPSEPKAANIPLADDDAEELDDDKRVIDDPVIVDDNADDVRRNDENQNTSSPETGNEGSNSSETGSGETAGTGSGETGTTSGTGNIPIDSNKPVPTGELDRLPEFPGGIKKFYDYVGRRFEKPNITEEGIKTVLLSFVIETNGDMSDIQVLRSAGREIDREALRVLKSLKTRWKSGMKNGEPVRTLYTLPITVDMKNLD